MNTIQTLLLSLLLFGLLACGGKDAEGSTDQAAADDPNSLIVQDTGPVEDPNSGETLSDETVFYGQWKWDKEAAKAQLLLDQGDISPEQKSMMESMLEPLAQTMTKSRFEFQANGKYIYTDPEGQKKEGSWSISDDKKRLETDAPGEGEMRFELQEYSKEKIVLRATNRASTQEEKRILIPAGS